jgi:hypothetical protein
VVGAGDTLVGASDRWSRFFAALLGEAPIDQESVILTEDITVFVHGDGLL